MTSSFFFVCLLSLKTILKVIIIFKIIESYQVDSHHHKKNKDLFHLRMLFPFANPQ